MVTSLLNLPPGLQQMQMQIMQKIEIVIAKEQTTNLMAQQQLLEEIQRVKADRLNN
jgi:hypothetical protein